MKYCSRASLVILIGAINIIAAVTGFIYVLTILDETVLDDDRRRICRILLITFITETIISALLVLGVTQKQHNYFLPWLILKWTCVVANIFKILYNVKERTFTTREFAYDLISISIQLLILHPVSTLFAGILIRRNGTQKGVGKLDYAFPKRILHTIPEV